MICLLFVQRTSFATHPFCSLSPPMSLSLSEVETVLTPGLIGSGFQTCSRVTTHVFDSYIIKYAEKKEKVTLSSRNYYCTFSSWTGSEVRGIMSYAVKLTLSSVNPRELESVVFISLLFKIKSVSFNFRSLGNRFFCLFVLDKSLQYLLSVHTFLLISVVRKSVTETFIYTGKFKHSLGSI